VSSYPETSARPASANPARRPGTLTTAMVFAIVGGLAAIGNGIKILTGGKDLIQDLIVQAAGIPAEALSSEDWEFIEELSGISMTELESTFQTRSYIVLAGGVLLVLFGVLMSKAAVWARALVTVGAVLTMGISAVIVADEANGAMVGLGLLAIVASLVALILVWLPPNNRYARSFR
jgi:hypothetical protein